jgi:hypothetical protein
LDSLLSLGKFVPNGIINLSSYSNSSQINSPYSIPCNNAELSNAQQMSPNFHQDKYIENEYKQNDFIVNVGHTSQDGSMPFLSLSLK